MGGLSHFHWVFKTLLKLKIKHFRSRKCQYQLYCILLGPFICHLPSPTSLKKPEHSHFLNSLALVGVDDISRRGSLTVQSKCQTECAGILSLSYREERNTSQEGEICGTLNLHLLLVKFLGIFSQLDQTKLKQPTHFKNAINQKLFE